MLRMVRALQLHDAENVSTPADWTPGEDVLLGSPLTLEEADRRLNSGDGTLEPLSWYLTVRKQ